MLRYNIQIDENEYLQISRILRMDELKTIAKKHNHKRKPYLFALETGAEQIPYSEVFVMDCPQCGERNLFYDADNFYCLSCKRKGRFSELETMHTQQIDHVEGK